MADLLLQVPLRTKVNKLFATTVFKEQFVGALPTQDAAAAQDAASLVLGQGIGRPVQRIRQATVDQRPVRIPFQERHQNLHAHPRIIIAPNPSPAHPEATRTQQLLLSSDVSRRSQ